MRPVWHVVVGGGLGVCLYQMTQSWQLSVDAALTEVFIDLDHLIEHLTWSKNRFCLRSFLQSYNVLSLPRMIYLLHSYELIVLLAIAGWYSRVSLFWAIALGAIIHLGLDEVGNRTPSWLAGYIVPGFYFFTYRLMQKFRTDALVRFRQVQ